MINSKQSTKEIRSQQNPDLDPTSPLVEHDAPHLLDPPHVLEDEI